MREPNDAPAFLTVDALMEPWRQGDIAAVRIFQHFADLRRPVTTEAVRLSESEDSRGLSVVRIGTEVEGLVVLTQTCDIRRPAARRPYVSAALMAPTGKPAGSAARRTLTRGRRAGCAICRCATPAPLPTFTTAQSRRSSTWPGCARHRSVSRRRRDKRSHEPDRLRPGVHPRPQRQHGLPPRPRIWAR